MPFFYLHMINTDYPEFKPEAVIQINEQFQASNTDSVYREYLIYGKA